MKAIFLNSISRRFLQIDMFMKSNKLILILGYSLYSELRLHTFIYYNKNIVCVCVYIQKRENLEWKFEEGGKNLPSLEVFLLT
jgi:hypothetical protein